MENRERSLINLGAGMNAQCPILHAQKLHPLVGGVFHVFWCMQLMRAIYFQVGRTYTVLGLINVKPL
ncbi:hypothetical protein [Nostoc sp.]|uniref:hypothetical protein n=1 Tax=Nostoc sp. TaxID=1180 RepID=UPI002FF4952C